MCDSGITKEAAVDLLKEAGYQAVLDEGVVLVAWNNDPDLPIHIRDFLAAHNYHASFGVKGMHSGTAALRDSSSRTFSGNTEE